MLSNKNGLLRLIILKGDFGMLRILKLAFESKFYYMDVFFL